MCSRPFLPDRWFAVSTLFSSSIPAKIWLDHILCLNPLYRAAYRLIGIVGWNQSVDVCSSRPANSKLLIWLNAAAVFHYYRATCEAKRNKYAMTFCQSVVLSVCYIFVGYSVNMCWTCQQQFSPTTPPNIYQPPAVRLSMHSVLSVCLCVIKLCRQAISKFMDLPRIYGRHF